MTQPYVQQTMSACVLMQQLSSACLTWEHLLNIIIADFYELQEKSNIFKSKEILIHDILL